MRFALHILCILNAAVVAYGADSDWRSYGLDTARTNFSPLDQIEYNAGNNSDTLKTSIDSNPLIVDGAMYVVSPVFEVIALNAVTGQEIWKFSPFPERPGYARAWLAGLALLGIVVGTLWLVCRFLKARASSLLAASTDTIFPLLIPSIGWFDVDHQKSGPVPARFSRPGRFTTIFGITICPAGHPIIWQRKGEDWHSPVEGFQTDAVRPRALEWQLVRKAICGGEN